MWHLLDVWCSGRPCGGQGPADAANWTYIGQSDCLNGRVQGSHAMTKRVRSLNVCIKYRGEQDACRGKACGPPQLLHRSVRGHE